MNTYSLFWKALDQRHVPDRYRFPLAIMSMIADDELICWPTQSWLGDRMGCSPSEVNRRLRWLKDHGLISVVKRRWGGSNVYRLDFLDQPPELLRARVLSQDLSPAASLSKTH